MTYSMVLREARSWIGTPFKHLGRTKGVGCDCLGLIMGVATTLNLQTRFQRPIIELDRLCYHLIHHSRDLEQMLDEHLAPSALQFGSIALMTFDHHPQHLAIISDHPHCSFGIIHADLGRKMVVEHSLCDEYMQRIQKIYAFSIPKQPLNLE